MLIPMPPVLVDVGLSVSITLSVMILMITLFIRRPLEFLTFPTILLITTALRLGLNLASTRLILSNGDQGHEAAGKIIETFGGLYDPRKLRSWCDCVCYSGDCKLYRDYQRFGRIVEVAARFSLMRCPVSKMAIDPDLSAGLITEDEAKKRSELQQESTFSAQWMVLQNSCVEMRLPDLCDLYQSFWRDYRDYFKDLTLAEAANNYSLLTIGDGLVSNSALIVSCCGRLLVA